MKLDILPNNKGISDAIKKINQSAISEVEIDFSDLTFITSDILVLLKSFFDFCKKKRLGIKAKNFKGFLRSYVSRMGLLENTLMENESAFSHQGTESFFPLFKIKNDRNEELEKYFRKIFHTLPSNQITRISESFTELADNIYYHSGIEDNKGHGYAHAQVYSKNNLNMALCDLGVGFSGSYQRHGRLRGRTNKQVLEDALEAGESCLNEAPQIGHRGVGLSEVADFIDIYSGQMSIFSGTNVLILKDKKTVVSDLTYNFIGTLIKIEVLL